MEVTTNVPERLFDLPDEYIPVPRTRLVKNNVPDVESLTEKQRQVYDTIIKYLLDELTIEDVRQMYPDIDPEVEEIRMISLQGYAGTGKAQPLSAIIHTPEGPKRMGDMYPGQLICTPDGMTARVLNVYPQGLKPVYKVSFSDGTSTECCNEHLWKVFTDADRNRTRVSKSKGRNKIHSSVLTTREMMGNLVSERGTLNYRVPVTKAAFFSYTGEKLIHPYLMGVLLGDGGLTQKLMFSTADKSMVLKVATVINQDKYYIARIQNSNYDYVIRSKTSRRGTNKYYQIIKGYHLDCKSENKYIPVEYLYSDVEQRTQLLQGLMDTDGTVSKNGFDITYSSSSKRLADDVAFLARSLGCIATVTVKPTPCLPNYIVRINQSNEFDVFTLLRKQKLVKPKTRYRLCKYITGIEYIGDKEQQCISIDDSEHLYITDDFIVTHNTYVITQVLKYFVMMIQKEIAVTAPTNKAVKVLKMTADFMHALITFATIHKLYGLKEKINELTGKITFEPEYGAETAIQEMYALILDETSMLQDDIFFLVEQSNSTTVKTLDDGPVKVGNDIDSVLGRVTSGPRQKDHTLKVIFLGDPVQIPPIGKQGCIPFNLANAREYGILTLELTEIIRQKEGNPILELATLVRQNYKKAALPYSRETVLNDVGGVIFINKKDKDVLFRLCEKYFSNSRFEQDSDFIKVIAWTNRTVDFMNDKIRSFIYKDRLAQLQVENPKAVLPRILIGEKLIANSPILEDLGYQQIPLYSTNDEFEVIEHRIGTVKVFQSYEVEVYITKVSSINYSTGKRETKTINILHEDSISAFNEVCENTKKAALKAEPALRGQAWKLHYLIKGKFADVKYNYAITAHKSQGSTYDNAIVIVTDIDKNSKVEERNRIKYVAFTRPKQHLFIVE